MSEIPEFTLYGNGDLATEQSIQPALSLRQWSDLSDKERRISLDEIENRKWIGPASEECLTTIAYLNETYLRACPGKRLHKDKSSDDYHRRELATADFIDIFLHEKSDALVLRMLSKFTECLIYKRYLTAAKNAGTEERDEYVAQAFDKFDRFARCLNHIFEQFSVNQLVTRNGFVPRQDDKITSEIYAPTLKALSDPKWSSVSSDLAGMFDDFRHERFAEVITKAHSAVQRFLQILVGEEGKSGKGELAKLFRDAKEKDIIPSNRFIDPVIGAISGFIPSERATNSTAKPALKQATSSDAMLMMNVVMILLQYCLQNTK